MPKPISWKNETRKVSELVPHPLNPRKISETQIAQLTESLTRFNLAEIPVINTDNQLLAGHQRCKILIMLERSDEVIDVRVPNRKLTKAECKEYLVRSNKNGGEWDWDLLAEGFDLDGLLSIGFEDWEMTGSSVDSINQKTKDEEWEGMPAFEAKEKPLELVVRFSDESARANFFKKFDITVSTKGKYTWSARFPHYENEDPSSLRYD